MNYQPPPDRDKYDKQVWALVRRIPPGKLATYGQLSQMIEPPEDFDPVDYKVCSPRWVGNAMAACPDGVPWHRVVNSQGKISQTLYADRQKQLLEAEGLYLVNGKLDLGIYQWGGNDGEATPEQGALF